MRLSPYDKVFGYGGAAGRSGGPPPGARRRLTRSKNGSLWTTTRRIQTTATLIYGALFREFFKIFVVLNILSCYGIEACIPGVVLVLEIIVVMGIELL